MEPSLRTEAEARFGHDFSAVRVHTDPEAAESARAVGARAYTAGSHVVFGAGAYTGGTVAGRRLVHHELTHVVQQHGRTFGSGEGLAMLEDPVLEAEAERGAELPHRVRSGVARGVLQRAPADLTCAPATATVPPNNVCSLRTPERCDTYEQWISLFTDLSHFTATASPTPSPGGRAFDVIGAEPAARYGAAGGNPAAPITTAQQLGEQFIDHPTDAWVRNCLPDNLRATAYQLPADCADVVLILRHVWLAAHRRSEIFRTAGRNWTIGDEAGRAAASRIGTVISNIGTVNIAPMVLPYTDPAGNPLLTWDALEPLLHPGDMLVWAHFQNGFDRPRTGGHAHTIASIDRDENGRIRSFTMLQGNQPIFEREKTEIIRAARYPDTARTRGTLGETPGRRIERSVLTRSRFTDPPVGTGRRARRVIRWDAHTLLVAAGPARAAARPARQRGSSVRQLSDWIVTLNAARTRGGLVGAWEAMLSEARATIEGGASISESTLQALGRAAGNALWRNAKRAGGFGTESHVRVIDEMHQMLEGFQRSRRSFTGGTPDPQVVAITGRLSTQLASLGRAFLDAARGGADISFRTGRRAAHDVNVLLTGFDPFHTSAAHHQPPREGEWNPSGAAVMALDGASVPISGGASAQVQGIVLPVWQARPPAAAFREFAGGIVERIVRPHLNVIDAAISVSVDATLAGSPVRLERWAVGVHRRATGGPNNFVLEPIAEDPGFAASAGGAPSSPGAAFIEATDALGEIKRAPRPSARAGRPGIQEPAVGEDVTFRIIPPSRANAAMTALGTGSTGPVGTVRGDQITVVDPGALRRIASAMSREQDGITIRFTLGGQQFRAHVLRGPGGDFLSNEVSYRLLRLLGRAESPRNPMSFHIHTEGGNLIPSDVSTRAARQVRQASLRDARGIRDRLVRTLRWVIASVGRIVLRRRAARP